MQPALDVYVSGSTDSRWPAVSSVLSDCSGPRSHSGSDRGRVRLHVWAQHPSSAWSLTSTCLQPNTQTGQRNVAWSYGHCVLVSVYIHESFIVISCWQQVSCKALKGRIVIGVAAGRFHTVLWTRDALYTIGLNGGQLGKRLKLIDLFITDNKQTCIWPLLR